MDNPATTLADGCFGLHDAELATGNVEAFSTRFTVTGDRDAKDANDGPVV